MEEFILTDDMKLAIKILELAGYEVQLGETIFLEKRGASKTFRVLENGKVRAGVSSTFMLNPKFVIKRVIEERSFNKGFEEGKKKIQKQIKELLDITTNS